MHRRIALLALAVLLFAGMAAAETPSRITILYDSNPSGLLMARSSSF